MNGEESNDDWESIFLKEKKKKEKSKLQKGEWQSFVMSTATRLIFDRFTS